MRRPIAPSPALAAHFIESGLPANSVIAVQLPNTIEFALTVLAAYRAGLVVAVLPLLWRQAELTMALNRTAARAIVTTSKIDGIVYADLAMNAAAEAFSIRHVCGFGTDLPEGMASLDNAILRESTTTRAVIQDGRKAALISFDVTSDGFRPVPRAHLGLIAGGLAVSLESDVPQGANHAVGIFADVVCRPRLLAGGLAAVGRNPGAAPSLRRGGAGAADQRACLRHADCAGATGVAAGRTRPRARLPSLRNVIGLWRAPEQVASSASWAAAAGDADRRLSVRRGRIVRRPPHRRGRLAGPDQARPARRAARIAGVVDRGRYPADAPGHARIARTDGCRSPPMRRRRRRAIP